MNIKRLAATTYGHFSIDILNASIAMILTAMSDRFGLSIGQIALGALLYTVCAAMSQPIFGTITDRLRGRWVAGLGLLWTIIFYIAAMFMPTYPTFLGCLMIGGLGSGAFHAAGVLNAPASGGKRATLATSIFFLGGQSGLAVGPIIAGSILGSSLGIQGLAFTALAMLPAVVAMLIFMHAPLEDPPKTKKSGSIQGRKAAVTLVVVFMLLIMLRSGTAQSFSTLLPKFFAEKGFEPQSYGYLLGWFNLMGAMGTFASGFLGDRFDRRWTVVISLLISVPFAYTMLHVDGWGYFAAAALAAFSMSISHTILIVMAQELAPSSRGLVGGLVLGFIFASGSTVAWVAGTVADVTGLPMVLNVLAFLPLAAGLCALLLPKAQEPELSPVVVTAAAN